jgi:ketosteroid isomerase-like protein
LQEEGSMKLILGAILLAVAGSTLASGPVQNQSRSSATTTVVQEEQPEKALRQLEEEFLQALLKADLPTLNRIWADEFSLTIPTGAVVSRENYLSLLQSGIHQYETLKLEDLSVRVYGDSAVVIGRVTLKGNVGSHKLEGQDRYLTVYVKRQGRWQQVASQTARISQETH